MTVRREKIILEVDDLATAKFVKAAAGAGLLEKALNDLDGKNVSASRSTNQLGTDVDRNTAAFQKGGAEIDRFSGRLAVYARAAALIGPAVVPFGAGLVPALAGMTAGLGAAAGALGVTLLAATGLGDGLKALNQYQLEPTAANAAKLQQEFEKLGPSGEHFVRYLDSLGPQMRDLQFLARDGLLPGVEEGIDSLLTRMPQLRSIIADISTELGDIAGDTGSALAGSRFDAFFEYLDREAAPIMRSFATATGNLAETLANLLVGVDPLTDSFLGGLVDKTGDLARWSRDLDDSEGFQNFLEYAERSGPKVAAFLGSFAESLAAIAQAAAPVGDVVLPALTAILDVTTALANSSLGTPIFATLAAMSALSTATKVWGAVSATSVGQFVAGQTAAAGAANKTRASLASLGKTAGVVGGIILVTSAVNALAHANDELEASAGRAQDALDRGDRSAAQRNIDDLEAQTDALEELARRSDETSNVVESFQLNILNGDVFANNFKDLFGESEVEQQRRRIEELRFALDSLDTSNPFTSLARLDPVLAGNADAFGRAAAAADDYANTLADVQGLLDQRSAWRAYQAAIDDASEALKQNGKTHNTNKEAGRANVEALDRISENAHRFAENLKGLERINFLAGARREFIGFARDIGYSRQRAQALADDLGLLAKQKPTPKVNLDTSTAKERQREIDHLLTKLGLKRTDPEVGMMFGAFLDGDREVLRHLRILDASKASPTVTAETAGAQAAIGGVRAALASIPSSVTTTVYTVRREINQQSVAGRADGGTIYGQRQPYGDKVLAYLAPGEEVISNRFGQADRNRSLLKAINANRMADGGTAGGDVREAAGAHIKELRAALRETTRALARMTRSLDANRDQLREMRQYRSEVGGSLAAELTGGGLAQFDLANAASRNDARTAARALKAARRKGLDGPLFDLVAASGDLALIRDFANLNAFQIQRREQAFAQTNSAQRQFGSLATTEKFDRSIDRQEDIVKAQAATVKRLERREKRLESSLERATERGSRRGTREGARGAARDRRQRNGSRRRNGGH